MSTHAQQAQTLVEALPYIQQFTGKTVVVNLEEADLEVSRRLLDFLSGVAYAQNGEIRRVATKTFVIIPNGVELVGDALDGLQSNSVVY